MASADARRGPCGVTRRECAGVFVARHETAGRDGPGRPASHGGQAARRTAQEEAQTGFDAMMAQMSGKAGFIAALDQSGGSTPAALSRYGIAASDDRDEADMFRLMHQMRLRIMTAPAFGAGKIIGAILFEQTMDAEIDGLAVPAYLWDRHGIVPFVKVDRGREAEKDGAQILEPMPDLDALLVRAASLGVYGTKMRSAVSRASRAGIAAAVKA